MKVTKDQDLSVNPLLGKGRGQKKRRIQWAIDKFDLSVILYYGRRKDYLVSLKNKAPGAFTARWFSGFGWGFIGYGR
ncbi:hypothetical protein LCGC14_1134160 [marine sediment metagenome]|uniref:Uncharacterized protein n=1 Tax=marine sediment metagenome TaxID=412755 RepID=A0A0F9PIH2_9ZZZZ